MGWASLAAGFALALSASAHQIEVPIGARPPKNASDVVARDWQSFSIEFSSFADYGGNKTHPNHFSNNLFANLKREVGVDTIIRIGGNTGDHVTYFPGQKEGLVNFFDYTYNLDQPRNTSIGPNFWQSMNALQHAKFIPQLNFYKNDSKYLYNMEAMVNQTLAQVPRDRIHLFEIGNENDYGALSGFRPPDWTLMDYVMEWQNRSESLQAQHGDKIQFYAPSFCCFGVRTNYSYFHPIDVWNSTFNYNKDHWIKEISQHGYISGTGQNNTLQGTLMNHTNIRIFVENYLKISRFHIANGRYFTLGETNSISGQGAVSVSDVFGAALWEIDYCLYIASQNVRRIHLHQGTSYRYASWLPIQVNGTGPYVKPGYYGNMFIARFLGSSDKTRIAHHLLPDQDEHNVAYAAYDDGKLARVALLNMLEYNITHKASDESYGYGGNGGQEDDHRPSTTFKFPAPHGCRQAKITKLWSPEAHENSTILFDGHSYDYKLGKGKPVKIKGEDIHVKPKNGMFEVDVEASGAVIVTIL